jgi:hypothetical protein
MMDFWFLDPPQETSQELLDIIEDTKREIKAAFYVDEKPPLPTQQEE